MQVKEEPFGMVYRRMDRRTRLRPLPIQILTSQRATMIAIDDAVRIQHGHDLEDVLLSGFLGLVGIA